MKSLKEKWESSVQSMDEKGENEVGGSSTVKLPPLCYAEHTKRLLGTAKARWAILTERLTSF